MIPDLRAFDKRPGLEKMYHLTGFMIYGDPDYHLIEIVFSQGFMKGRCSDFVIMQHIGLKDREGNKIYVGDILQYKDSETNRFVVEFRPPCFVAVRGKDPCACITRNVKWISELKIIGNIHQHKHLLNGVD